jgi:hypothetical protein
MARNYDKEYKNYQGSEEQKHNRALRNKARRTALKNGTVHKGDNKDIDHKKPLSKGGSGAMSNTRVQTTHDNRSFRRNSNGSIKLID